SIGPSAPLHTLRLCVKNVEGGMANQLSISCQHSTRRFTIHPVPHNLIGSGFAGLGFFRVSSMGSLLLLLIFTGCQGLFHRSSRSGGAGAIQNPLFIPPVDRELFWNQTVDAVDDYFRIEREDRLRLIGGVLTEGRIDTFPTIGSTLFEPWRVD